MLSGVITLVSNVIELVSETVSSIVSNIIEIVSNIVLPSLLPFLLLQLCKRLLNLLFDFSILILSLYILRADKLMWHLKHYNNWFSQVYQEVLTEINIKWLYIPPQ